MSLRAFIRTFWCICSVSVLVCLKTLKDELWSVVFVEFNDVSNGNSACGDFGISVLDCPTGEGNLLFLINSFFYVFVFLRRNWTPQAILYLKGARKSGEKKKDTSEQQLSLTHLHHPVIDTIKENRVLTRWVSFLFYCDIFA
uniref:Uncharacterized protein n=1 Tax=Oryzias latipes TaxID=8090 RepID=A0A3B3I1T1_ORYLA